MPRYAGALGRPGAHENGVSNAAGVPRNDVGMARIAGIVCAASLLALFAGAGCVEQVMGGGTTGTGGASSSSESTSSSSTTATSSSSSSTTTTTGAGGAPGCARFTESNYLVGVAPVSVAVGDLDGDGK